MRTDDTVTMDDVRVATERLGLAGQAVCVHASLRSFGRVEGGAAAVVAGLLAAGCTVLVPTFTNGYRIPAPPHLRFPRNGWDYDNDDRWTPHDRVYTPETDEINANMGAIPAAVLANPGRVRGKHPLNSFAAVGPRAHDLIAGQTPLDVYAPFDALIAAGGAIVLMGVGLARMTFIHHAESHAGRARFRRWANGADGRPMVVAVGGCSAGFGALLPAVAPLMRATTVGVSLWQVFPARETLIAFVRAIRTDPAITHCADPACDRCNDAIAGGPLPM